MDLQRKCNEGFEAYFNRLFVKTKNLPLLSNDTKRRNFLKQIFRKQGINMDRIIVPFEKKALNKEGEFEGYGSTFGNIDFGDDIIEKGAFIESLSEYKARQELPLMPWFHDMKMPVGDWVDMKEDDYGLFVKGKLWLGDKQIESSKMVHNLLTGTGPKGMSIGFSSIESDFKEIDDSGVTRYVRVIKKLKLYELSIVPFGMNPKALVTSAKALDSQGNLMDLRSFEKLLRDDLGLSTSQAKTVISKGYKEVLRDADNTKETGLDRDEKVIANDILESIKKTTNIFKN